MTKNIEKLTSKIIENPSADLYFRRAMTYFNNDKNDLAIKDCDEGLKLDKKHLNCFSLRIDALSDLKRYDEALEECSKAIALDPDWAAPYNGRGDTYYYQNLYNEAIAEYSKAIELAPDWAYPHNGRGIAYAAQERYNEAIGDYTKAIELDPSWETPYNGRGNIYYNQNRYDEAIEDYTKAIEINPDWSYPYNGRGSTYRIQNLYDEAIEDYTKAIEINPDWAYPYNGRGNVYYRQNLYNEAIEDYNKAIGLEPGLAYPYNGRGNIYYNQGYYNEAVEEYTRAIELKPDFAYPYNGRGNIYYNQGHYNKAIKDLKKAYELYGEDSSYYKSIVKNKIDEITALLKSRDLEKKDNIRKIIDKTIEFQKEININKKSKNDFYNHKHVIPYTDNFKFTVLRKWNSFTPIVGSGFRASKGGGYFIKSGNKGIVIDPGFNFIENFMASGHKFKEIDAVLITHAHNDHTADLDSLLTVLYKYNEDLLGSYTEYKDGSIVDDVLQELKYSREMINSDPEKKKEVEKKVDKQFKEKRKVITFYITSGTFKKYASFFNLMKSSNYKIICVDEEHFKYFNIDSISISVIKAKHYDIMSDTTAVGFCFEYGDFALIYTGDTGFWGMDETYQIIKKQINKKRIILVANLGGFKEAEDSYSKETNNEKCYYPNHLGRLGIAKLVEIIKPEICIISEFGEEFNGYRIKVADVFNDVYREHLKTVFLPADVGLCVNSEMQVLAIINATPKISSDKLTDKDGFLCEFIQPADVHVDEVDQISELYYYSKKVDAKALAKKKVAKFYESLR